MSPTFPAENLGIHVKVENIISIALIKKNSIAFFDDTNPLSLCKYSNQISREILTLDQLPKLHFNLLTCFQRVPNVSN